METKKGPRELSTGISGIHVTQESTCGLLTSPVYEIHSLLKNNGRNGFTKQRETKA